MTRKGEMETPRASPRTGKPLCIDPEREPDRATFMAEEKEPGGLERLAQWCTKRSEKGEAACRWLEQPRCFFVNVDRDTARQALMRQASRYGVGLKPMADPFAEYLHLPKERQDTEENGGPTTPWTNLLPILDKRKESPSR